LSGFVSPVHFGYDPNSLAIHYDPSRARELLKEAGYGWIIVEVLEAGPEQKEIISKTYNKTRKGDKKNGLRDMYNRW